MEEVIAFSDRVCVLHKGRLVTVKKTDETNSKELVRLMVGRDGLFRLEKKAGNPGDIILILPPLIRMLAGSLFTEYKLRFIQDRRPNKLCNLACLLARLLRCVKGHIRKECTL